MEAIAQKMRLLDRSQRNESGSARRLRERHAARYVRIVRPIVMSLSLFVVVLSELIAPEGNREASVITVTAGAAVSVISMPFWSRINPLTLASITAVADLALVIYFVLSVPFPAQSAVILIWPVIAIAYTGTPRGAAVAGLIACLIVWIASMDRAIWIDTNPIPTSLLGVAGAGILISFVTLQGRRVEQALAVALARDRVAFMLTQRIRMADDPSAAIQQIASMMGDATGASQSLVILLEHDEDFVADLATWHRDQSVNTSSQMLERDVLDTTLTHLVASGHGAALQRGEIQLLDPERAYESSTEGSTSAHASVERLFKGISAHSGIIVPLMIAGRVVGALVLASEDEHDWTSQALPLLEQLAPQLAAGLAQAVLLRDQREALDSLERLDRMRDRLIANVSHELRTPLTSTIGFVETLLRDDVQIDPLTKQQLLEHAKDGGMRLLALVEDLLTLGSTRPESLDLAPEPLDAAALIESALLGITEPPSRKIVVVTAPGTSLIADRNRTIQVVINLVTNALRHGRGDVYVRASNDRSGFVLDVIDDGDGIDPDHLGELFLPFANFSSRTDSTGLGLAICRTIVEAHGGTIAYDRIEHAHQTRFRVRIPTVNREARL